MYRQVLIVAASLALAAPAAWADSTRFGIDAEVERDDNVTRGPQDADRRDDTLLGVGAFVTRSILLGPKSGAVLRAGAKYNQFTDFDDLSNIVLSARAAYRVQPVVGFSTPWIELAADLQYLSHADSELRDGTIASLTASVGSHVTDRIRLSAGAGLDRRNGDSTGLYDLSTTRLFATLDYRVGLESTIYGRIAHIDGDHVFNAIDGTSQSWLSAINEVLVSDPALGPGFVAYRLDAKTLVYDIGFNFPLRGPHTLDVSLTYYKSETDRDAREYDGTQVRLAYLYRFQ